MHKFQMFFLLFLMISLSSGSVDASCKAHDPHNPNNVPAQWLDSSAGCSAHVIVRGVFGETAVRYVPPVKRSTSSSQTATPKGGYRDASR